MTILYIFENLTCFHSLIHSQINVRIYSDKQIWHEQMSKYSCIEKFKWRMTLLWRRMLQDGEFLRTGKKYMYLRETVQILVLNNCRIFAAILGYLLHFGRGPCLKSRGVIGLWWLSIGELVKRWNFSALSNVDIWKLRLFQWSSSVKRWCFKTPFCYIEVIRRALLSWLVKTFLADVILLVFEIKKIWGKEVARNGWNFELSRGSMLPCSHLITTGRRLLLRQ